MDDIERAAVADEGYDPDDPGVIAALARVSAVLTKLGPLLREASAALDEQTDSREELLARTRRGCASSVLGLARPGGTEGRGWCLHDLGSRPLHLRGDGRSRARAEDIDAPDEPVKGKRTSKPSQLACKRPTKRRSVLVYVCDRFIVPHLSGEQQGQVADGRLSLDALTRQHIRDRYEYRFVTTPDGGEALALEREVQRGALSAGKPFLNPL